MNNIKKKNFEQKFEIIMLKLENYIDKFINEFKINTIDYEFNLNIFKIKCIKTRKKLIITRQISLKQIWIATKKYGYYFKYHKKKKKWLCKKSKKEITNFLKYFFFKCCKKKIFLNLY